MRRALFQTLGARSEQTVGCEPLAVERERSRSMDSLEDRVGLGW